METTNSLGNLPMVRCKTCNRPIGNIYNRFIKARQEFQDIDDMSYDKPFKTPAERAFDILKVSNRCCRANLQNPPRIPVGGYFYEQQNIPNTYIIGEHGVNYGDPTVIDFLRSNAVDEGKRQILQSGVRPVHKRVISTSNVRYGKKFTPNLLELSSDLVDEYINLSLTEQDNTIKALWEVFLSSMYIRGWKGPGYGYPIQGTGPKVPRVLNTLLKVLMKYIEDWNVASYPKLRELKEELSIVPNHDNYVRMLDGMVELDDNKIFGVITDISPEYIGYTPSHDDIKGYVTMYFEQVSDLIGSLIVDITNIDKVSEHMEMFWSYYNSSIGIQRLMSHMSSINFYMGQPVKRIETLKTVIESSKNTLNTSRIIALSAYYTINILTGKTIQNFDPKSITGDESGITFQEPPIQFIEFKN